MRALMYKYASVAFLLAVAGFMVRCGGNSLTTSSTPSTPSTSSGTTSTNTAASMGSVVVFGQDAPVCNVVSFMVTITAATLTPQSGGAAVTLLPSGKPLTVDFARLMDFSTILSSMSVPVGTYSSASLTLSNPQLMVLDVTQTPPAVVTLPTTLTTTTVTAPIQPALDATGAASKGLDIEFDLRKSVETDSNGQVTGTVNPVFNLSGVTASGEEGLGELDDLAGLVQSVTTTSATASFNGSFTLLAANGSTMTVNTTPSTQFDVEEGEDDEGGGLDQLAQGAFVEVDAVVDSNGNVVANEVDVEEQESEADHQSAFVGLVTSVTRDASGDATQFTLFVRDEDPDESSVVEPRTAVTVTIDHTTRFKLTANGTNKPGLQFDASTLGPGQEVVAHGKAEPQAPTPTLSAKSIFLRLRSVPGNFVSLLQNSDGSRGVFTLTPCGPLFHGQPITVVTVDTTAFVGVSGLAALTSQPTLVVKGLLFYEQQPITVQGVAVTTPGWVLETKKVHQLSQ